MLADLSRRALADEPIADLMAWAVRHVADILAIDHCCILELLPNDQAMACASFGEGAICAPTIALPLDHYPLATKTLQSGQPIVIGAKDCERSSADNDLLSAHGIRSGVSLIISHRPPPYGLLCVYHTLSRRFTRADITLLQAVADLLAQVIPQRSRQQKHDSVLNLSYILRQAATRDEIMAVFLAYIRAVYLCEGAAIILRDEEGRASVTRAEGVWADAIGTPIPAGPGPSWQVLRSGQIFLGAPSDIPLASAAPQNLAAVCVAMSYSQRPIGALWVAYAAPVSYHDQQLLVALADVAAIAINRSHQHEQTTRLYQEHQQLTQEVRRAERYLASIVESASDIILATDTYGRIGTWNRAAERIADFTRAQMIGRYMWELFAPVHRPIMDEMIKGIAAGMSFGQIEIPLISAAGQEVPVSWRLSLIQSDTGESAGIVAIGRDLAERRRLESQLFQAAKMASMGVMASGIGHELRNPLGIISANAQLAQERLDDQEMVRICLQQVHSATKRAALIIDNLLTFARPRDGTSAVMDLNEVLAATFLLLDYQIQQRRVRLSVTLEHPLAGVIGNAALIQQVFTNVILNALQAMEGGGTLRVTTRVSEATSVEVIFTDTGSGISPEVLPQIFDPFFTTRPVGQGTGLGLAISYSIIQQHGGSIEAVSPPGEGSTFCVRLPSVPGT